MGGTDKALLPLAGRPLAAHLADRLRPQVQALAISANGDPARLAFLGLPVLPDTQPSRGPLSGVLAALLWARAQGATALVTAAVDTPFLPPDLAPRLLAAGQGRLTLARSDGRLHPTAALWPTTLAGDLQAFLGSGETPRMMSFVQRHAPAFADVPEGSLANLNTPADLAAAEARLRGTAP